MSYNATVFKVMIASPGDVLSERNIIRELLADWNVVNADSKQVVLLPVGWETHSVPEMGDRPQAIINRQVLRGCDLLIGVFWTRIGTATGKFASGSVEEIEEHIRADRPVMLYFSNSPVPPDSMDPEQYQKLKAFRKSCRSRGLYESYADIGDFRAKLYRQLQLKINQDSYFRKEINTIETSAPHAPPPVKFNDNPPHYTLIKRAESGDDEAQYELAKMYLSGDRIPKDNDIGIVWLRKAADQNNLGAINYLGGEYERGIGVDIDYDKAFQFYKKAAEQGYAIAQYNLGLSYIWGKGVDVDDNIALIWLNKAADQGLMEADDALSDLARHMD